MQYKLYSYTMSDAEGREISPDRHFSFFQQSIWKDDAGRFSEYRGRRDAVLMYVRKYQTDFAGLIGRHATEREVTSYIEDEDETRVSAVDDDDYPNVPFICMPRLRMLACVQGQQVTPDSALHRLHSILSHRQNVFFVFSSVREPADLRKAVKRFRVVEVSFELLPVNPHTGDLGRALDESRKKDHIERIVGKAVSSPSNPMTLDGGFLSAVQQLQASGHGRVGFRGLTSENIEVSVPRPAQARELAEDENQVVFGEDVDVRIVLSGLHLQYPFDRNHVLQIRKIASAFSEYGDLT